MSKKAAGKSNRTEPNSNRYRFIATFCFAFILVLDIMLKLEKSMQKKLQTPNKIIKIYIVTSKYRIIINCSESIYFIYIYRESIYSCIV